MKTLDMLGRPCPIPVVTAKNVLEEQGEEGVIVLVDNIVAVQNLEKMAKGTGRGFSCADEGAGASGKPVYRVTIINSVDSGQSASEQANVPHDAAPSGNGGRGQVVLITADSMGRGDDELGRLLIKGFIFSLTQLNPLPEAVIFLNSGARLTTEGANTVPDLKTLEERGTGIFTCGTCANFYKLTDRLAVGSIIDMMNIVTRLSRASGIITI